MTIVPGQDNCSETDIKQLHRMDDHEVYVNIKGSRPPVETWQKKIYEKWEKDHPNEALDKNWNISIDAMQDSNGGENDANTGYLKTALYRSAVENMIDSSPCDRMQELVGKMKPRLQAVYQLAMLDHLPNTRVANLLGVSESMIRKDIKAIECVFRKDAILKSFFRFGTN